MKTERQEHGVTLVEMLVVIAVLSLVMAGIYGLLNTAYQAYMDSRRRIESQQTARFVLDYVVFRLREIDGGRNTDTPWNCLDCHTAGRAAATTTARANIPCDQDVSVPRSILGITGFSTDALTPLDFAKLKIPAQPAMGGTNAGNNISFKADLLPLFGFSESFTDSGSTRTITNTEDDWDWVAGSATAGDINQNNIYDDGEFELLEDLNENSKLDVYSEDWNLRLIKESGKDFYTLVESMNFSTSTRPKTKVAAPTDKNCAGGTQLLYNRSPYCDEGYLGQDPKVPTKNYAEIATGIVRMNIRLVPRYTNAQIAAITAQGMSVPRRCQDPSSKTACHGSGATVAKNNIYVAADKFDLAKFASTRAHKNWNTRGLIVEVTAGASKGGRTRLTTLQQFVIPRNLEINR